MELLCRLAGVEVEAADFIPNAEKKDETWVPNKSELAELGRRYGEESDRALSSTTMQP